MTDELFSLIEQSAKRMDSPYPKWLKERREPNFIALETGNSGPVMILLHGLMGALSNWDGVIPSMKDYSQVIALEFPIAEGHRTEVRVKALALYTEYFIRSRNLDSVILCGNSLGGHVALRVTLSSPEIVDKLILSGTSGLYEHTVDTLPIRPDAKFMRDQMERVFYQEQFTTDERVQEIMDLISNRTTHVNIIHSARSAKKDNLKALLKEVGVPTLLLWGEDDEVTPMTVANIFNEEIPNSELSTVKECGHAPMIEYPDWFSEEVKKFIA